MKTINRKVSYSPIPNGVLTATEATVAGEVITKLIEDNGCVKAEALVTASKPKSAPLHHKFTWDNNKAAEQFRIIEAQHIIRSVRIITDNVPLAEQPVIRAFVNVTAADDETEFEGRGYIAMTKVLSSERYRQQTLEAAKTELVLWKNRYRDLSDFFSGVIHEIEKVTG